MEPKARAPDLSSRKVPAPGDVRIFHLETITINGVRFHISTFLVLPHSMIMKSRFDFWEVADLG
jgi:hypothetical protein